MCGPVAMLCKAKKGMPAISQPTERCALLDSTAHRRYAYTVTER